MADLKQKFLETPGVRQRLAEIADKYGFTVDDLITVIGKESGFDPTIENKAGSGATGLIQWMPATAKGLGTTTADIAKMSIIEQLNLVDRYFEQNHTYGSHPYLTIAYPKAAKMKGDEIIAKPGSKIWKQNPGWRDEKGNVTPKSILGYVIGDVEADRKFVEDFGSRNYIDEATTEDKKSFEDEHELADEYGKIIKRFEDEAEEYELLKKEQEEINTKLDLVNAKKERLAEIRKKKGRPLIFTKTAEEVKELKKFIKENDLDKVHMPRMKEIRSRLGEIEQGGQTPEQMIEIYKPKLKEVQDKISARVTPRSQEIAKQASKEFTQKKQKVDAADGYFQQLDFDKSQEAQKPANKAFEQSMQNFSDSISEDQPEKDDFVYDKSQYRKGFGISPLIQGALAIAGVQASETPLPEFEAEEDAALMAYLQENKKIKEMGLNPAVEGKAIADLNAAYKAGMENITRASGGDRNLVLGNQSSMDLMRAQGMTNIAIADQKAKDMAFERYGQTLKHIDDKKHDANKINYARELEFARSKRAGGAAVANSAFANMMREIEHQKNNAPGSPNHILQTYVTHKLMGQTGAKEGPGSAEWAAEKSKRQSDVRIAQNTINKEKRDFSEILYGLDQGTRQGLNEKGYTAQGLYNAGVRTEEDVINYMNNINQPSVVPEVSQTQEPEKQEGLASTLNWFDQMDDVFKNNYRKI